MLASQVVGITLLDKEEYGIQTQIIELTIEHLNGQIIDTN